MKYLRSYSLYFAWVISLLGVIGSLYFGEGLGLEPCPLCWYQRIFLYPLAIFLGIAAYRKESRMKLYLFPLVILGGLIAFYQLLSGWFPTLIAEGLCGVSNCHDKSYEIMGGVSLPLLSLLGFFSIGVFLAIARD